LPHAETTLLSKIGSNCSAIIKALLSGKDVFGLACTRSACGALVLFADRDGIAASAGGALAAALCQGGLADMSDYTAEFGGKTLPYVRSRTSLPRLATLTLQSADCFEGVMLSGPIKLHLDWLLKWNTMTTPPAAAFPCLSRQIPSRQMNG
jgi:hypothetical protein